MSLHEELHNVSCLLIVLKLEWKICTVLARKVKGCMWAEHGGCSVCVKFDTSIRLKLMFGRKNNVSFRPPWAFVTLLAFVQKCKSKAETTVCLLNNSCVWEAKLGKAMHFWTSSNGLQTLFPVKFRCFTATQWFSQPSKLETKLYHIIHISQTAAIMSSAK